MKKVMVGFATAVLVFGLAGCSDAAQKDLFEAQLCLDRIQVPATVGATERTTLSTAVDSCMAKIAGKTSTQAYVLKCAGEFIRQGIAETKLVAAIQDQDEEGNTSDPSITTMNNLAFYQVGSYADAPAAAAKAVEYCTASESEALRGLAALADISTSLKSINEIAGGDVDNFVKCYQIPMPTMDCPMATDFSDPAQKEALANSLANNQNTLCNPDNGMFKDDEFCQNYNPSDACTGKTGVDLWLCNNQNANN